MNVLLRVLLPLTVLSLLLGCRPAETPAPSTSPRGPERVERTNPAGDSRDPGSMLSASGLGKEDYAKIRGELECLEAHFAEDDKALAGAIAAVYTRYGTTADWVAGVSSLADNSAFGDRIQGAVTARRAKVCPDGELDPAYLAQLTP